MSFRWLLAAAALALGLPALADGPLAIESAWLREPPPGRPMLALYMNLRNTGAAPLRLIGVRVDGSEGAGIHQSLVEDGMMRMRDVETLEIAPGASILFEPGGYHVMVFGVTAAPRAGTGLGFCLRLEGGAEQCGTARVKALGDS